jgi:rRNA maturation endonuclease Nob1
MNWFASDGRSTVISLQHDRSGDIRLMCHACNTRHAKMPGDLFYEVGPDKHRCPRCERILPLNAFWKDRSGDKWRNRWSYCKDCGGEINKIRYANRRADALLAELAKEPAP